jgi:hypothetical protein
MTPRSELARRIDAAIDRPLTHPGSQALARRFLDRFDGHADLADAFAGKALQTLADGQLHSLAVISPDAPVVAIHAQTWYGGHLEHQAARIGEYLGALLHTGQALVRRGVPLAALLQIDLYLRDDDPGAGTEVDAEFSLLPGFFAGADRAAGGDWPAVLLLNTSLLSDEERQALAKVQ